MPEGDTVLRTARTLHRALSGKPLTRTEFRWGALGEIDLAGRQVIETVAYGKHLLTRIAAGSGSAGPHRSAAEVPLTLHTHLRMDGSWRLHRTGSRDWPRTDDPQIRAVVAGSDWTCVGILLGMIDLVPTERESELVGTLGPDIMAEQWPATGRSEALRRWSTAADRPLGEVLLDQRVVAGIGTFYMAEALFARRLSPWTPASELDADAAGELLDTARRLLLAGAEQPVPNTTGDTRRKETSYVHARSGRPCRRCGGGVRVAGVGTAPHERPAFYCPKCQPGPAPTDDGRPQAPLGAAPTRPGSLRNVGLGPPRWRAEPGRGYRR